jgi:hypothetical protein
MYSSDNQQIAPCHYLIATMRNEWEAICLALHKFFLNYYLALEKGERMLGNSGKNPYFCTLKKIVRKFNI